MVSARVLRLASVVVLLLNPVAFAQVTESLTNDDVMKMVRAGLSASIVLTTIESARAVDFDLSPTALIVLKDAGVPDRIIEAMQARALAQQEAPVPEPVPPPEVERSDSLVGAKDPESILRTFKTMCIDASRAQFFGNDQMKAALRKDKDFEPLTITIVDDPAVADVVLEVGYTFAWDYPFSLKHQDTSVVLLSGKGSGPFSGPRGATSVAHELARLLKPYRTPSVPREVRDR